MSSSTPPMRNVYASSASAAAASVPPVAIGSAKEAAAAAAAAVAARGRSVSPGQYGAHAYIQRSPPDATGGAGAAGPTNAWPETGAPSPRTPRRPRPGGEFGLGAVVAELRRQNEADRRSVHRQLEHLERRVQEQLAAPSAGRERWADLQGSVSGMLEEMSTLARRVDGLEEKLRLRLGGCEELVRQRTRELEQQVHTLQQKTLLNSSTTEEMSKRQTARLRKLGQAVEEYSQRLVSVEDAARRPVSSAVDTVHLEARLSQLERQLAGHEDDLRSLTQSADARTSDVAASAMLTGTGQSTGGASHGVEEDNFDSIVRGLEREVSTLGQRMSVQLDEHAVALANLRVRSDGQEQRLAAVSERLETAVSPPLEALRTEVAQLREHDRQETQTQLEHLSKTLQATLEGHEDSTAELRRRMSELRADVQSHEPRSEDHHPVIHKLTETSATQEQAIRRLEAVVMDLPRHGSLPDELCGALMRLDSVEHRVDCLEQAGGEEELAEKADRAELTRIDAALQELSEPLRRLSQRTASNENRTVALERRLEQFQQIQGASMQPQPHDRLEELSAAAAGPSMDALADLTARVVELEGLLEHGRSLDSGGVHASHTEADSAALHAIRSHLAELSEQVAEVRGRAHNPPSSSRDQADPGSNLLHRLESGEDTARALQQQLHQLQSDLRKLEQEATGAAGQDDRISFLEKASRDMQQCVQDLRETSHHKPSLDDSHLKGFEQKHQAHEDHLAALKAETGALGLELRELKREEAELKALVESHSAHDRPSQSLSDLQQRVKTTETQLLEAQRSLEDLRQTCSKQLDERESASRSYRDLSATVDDAIQRISSCEKATTLDTANKVAELAGRIASSEESTLALKADVCQVEASLRDAHAKLESLAEHQSPPEALDGREGSQPHELEARVEKLQQQIADELEGLSQDILQARGSAPSEATEARVLELSSQVTAELRDLEEHQGDLTKVKTLVASLSQKAPAVEQDPAAGRAGSAMIAEAKAVSRLEATVDSLCKQVTSAVLAGEEGVQAAVALKDQLHRLQTEHDDLARNRIRTLEMRMDQLRSDHEGLSHAKLLDSDVAEKISDVMQRLKGGQEKIAAIERQVEQPIKALDSRLEQLRGDGELLKQAKAAHGDQSGSISELMQRLHANEEAVNSLQRQRSATGTEGGSAGPSGAVEAQIRELQRQVAEELHMLEKRQGDFAMMKAKDDEGVRSGEAEDGKEVEQAVGELAKQVAAELRDLREHQEDLGRVRVAVMALKSQGNQELMANGHSPDSEKSTRPSGSLALEAQVKELTSRVEEEFRALSGQQVELGDTRTAVGDLAKSVQECVSTCLNLQRQLDESRGRTSPVVGLAGKSTGISGTTGGASAASGRPGRAAPHAATTAADDSDPSDTFERESEESVPEESISESR